MEMTDQEMVESLASMASDLKATSAKLLAQIGKAEDLYVLKEVTSRIDGGTNKTAVKWGPVGTTTGDQSSECAWTEAVSIAKQGPLDAAKGTDGHTHVSLALTGDVEVS